MSFDEDLGYDEAKDPLPGPEPSSLSVKIIQATRFTHQAQNGLITIETMLPLFAYAEIRRRFWNFAFGDAYYRPRTEREVFSFYEPHIFYGNEPGFPEGLPIEADNDERFRVWWRTQWAQSIEAFAQIDRSVVREQWLAMLPSIVMVRRVITGTESAWRGLFLLKESDWDNRLLFEWAQLVQSVTRKQRTWTISDEHLPYAPDEDSGLTLDQRRNIAVARVARAPDPHELLLVDELEFFRRLKERRDLEAFGHVAYRTELPTASPLCAEIGDIWLDDQDQQWGWNSYRGSIDIGVGFRAVHPRLWVK